MQNKESLLYQCFKARYFPLCNILEAANPPNSSYAWKSIRAALPILKKGCYWRAGSGTSIGVKHDRWIPNYPTNRFLYPPTDKDWKWRVSYLINPISKFWDKGIIWSNFNRDNVEAICWIPLSHRHVTDSVMWLYKKSGNYSVKSGYHVAKTNCANRRLG